MLNLGKNSITHLTGGIFASLNGLRRLVLSENHITGINDNAFVGLDTLEEMRLRDNFLSRVPSVALQVSIYLCVYLPCKLASCKHASPQRWRTRPHLGEHRPADNNHLPSSSLLRASL